MSRVVAPSVLSVIGSSFVTFGSVVGGPVGLTETGIKQLSRRIIDNLAAIGTSKIASKIVKFPEKVFGRISVHARMNATTQWPTQ